MSPALPFRSHGRNSAPCTAAPAVLHLFATRTVAGDDRPQLLLRAELVDMPAHHVRRHAAIVLEAMVARFPGASVDVQIVDGRNVPLLLMIAGGVQ